MLVSGFVIVLVLIKVGLLLKQETLHFSFSDGKIKYKKRSFVLTNKTSKWKIILFDLKLMNILFYLTFERLSDIYTLHALQINKFNKFFRDIKGYNRTLNRCLNPKRYVY